MISSPLFEAWNAQEAATFALNEAPGATSSTASTLALGIPSVLEKDKSPSDRNITKWCSENARYNPNTLLKRSDRDYGVPLNDNPFIRCSEVENSPREKNLGDLNKNVKEYNDAKPPSVTTLKETDQQKLFGGNATAVIKTLINVNPATVAHCIDHVETPDECIFTTVIPDDEVFKAEFVKGKVLLPEQEVRNKTVRAIRAVSIHFFTTRRMLYLGSSHRST